MKRVTECRHCKNSRPSRMIRFPVISPGRKRHLAQEHSDGKARTICGWHVITDKWVRP